MTGAAAKLRDCSQPSDSVARATRENSVARRAAPASPPAPLVARLPIARLAASRAAASPAGLRVSSPEDASEREASATATRIMRMAAPIEAPARCERGVVQRDTAAAVIQRQPAPPSGAGSAVIGGVPGAGSGAPLPPAVRGFMEPRFGADFGHVRVHTGDAAARMSTALDAHAFTVGSDVFFGKDNFRPDSAAGKELIAHELTHTIQQGAAIQRSADVQVRQQSPRSVQRFSLNPLNWLADKANIIPGFRMFTIVLGVNPINMSRVEATPGNILRALIEFMPGGGLITQALDNSGVFDKVGNWAAQQIKTLGLVGSSIKQAVTTFIDSLSLSDLAHLGDVWDRAKRIFTEPIDRIIAFVKGLVSGIIQFVKDAILMPLAKLAEGTRGWDLLIAVLGKNPITGEPVPRTAETLIPGFLKLIGQEEVWQNMKKANALARAWAWFQGAMSALIGFVSQIPTLAINAFKSLELFDIILVPRAFIKVGAVFANFLGNFIKWAGTAVWNLLEIIFDVVSPGAFSYIKKTGAALKSILKNPLPFVGNLVKAAKLGFQNFAGNFFTHLKAGLLDWLTGSLPGVYIPKSFALAELVKFVFSVLGLSWQNVRQKLVKVVGEPAVKAMETGFDIVVTLVRDGPAAAWDKIKEELSNLQDMVIGGITDMVIDVVTKKAVPKLLAMFIPGAGFISAILSIYDTIMVFVEKLAKIIQVVTAFVDSIVAIAGGAIGAAAKRVESVLAGLLSLAISFLAGFVGLGKVADKVMGVINKVRAKIDKAIDRLIAWIVTLAKKLGRIVAQAGLPSDPEQRLRLGMDAALTVVNRFSGKTVGKLVIAPLLIGVKARYGFTSLELEAQAGIWWVSGAINPKKKQPSKHVRVGKGAENYPEGIKTMPLTIITFYVKGAKPGKPGLDREEFDRQLRIQKDAINAMVIQTWIDNRNSFNKGGRESKGDTDIKYLKSSFEAQLNGKETATRPSGSSARAKELAKLFDLAQSELERMKLENIAKNPKLADKRNYAELMRAVKKQFKDSVGLHRIDQIAGGSGTDIAGLGGAAEDFSIGAAWAQAGKVYRSRAETIHKFITDKIDKSVYPTEKMKVDLVSEPK